MAELPPEAEYGAIPFDLFALDHWDYSSSPDNDEQQWSNLVVKYLSLPERDRFPWHQNGGEVRSHPLLTRENINRVLRPNQTSQERIISSGVCPPCYNFLWLRTCYDPSLQTQYDELFGGSYGAFDRDWILDDETLYNFGSNRVEIVHRIVQRIPSLCDPYWASVEEDYELFLGGEEEGGEEELVKASNAVRSGVCVVDEEAIREGMAKVFWLGARGECLWHNGVEPGRLEEMAGTFKGGYSLWEGVETIFTRGGPG